MAIGVNRLLGLNVRGPPLTWHSSPGYAVWAALLPVYRQTHYVPAIFLEQRCPFVGRQNGLLGWRPLQRGHPTVVAGSSGAPEVAAAPIFGSRCVGVPAGWRSPVTRRVGQSPAIVVFDG